MPLRLALAATVLLLLPSGAAHAAVSLGQTANGGSGCGGGQTLAQTASSAPEYTVRAHGVVTELRTEDADAARTLHVLRPRGNDAFTLLTSVTAAAGSGVIRLPVRVAVQPGDVLGLSVPASPDPHPNCLIPGAAGPYDVLQARSGPPPASGDVTLPGHAGGRLNVAATLEPDADGDGFGDESQDRCPDDATRSDTGCSADVAVTQSPVERDLERDDVGVITIAVRNNGSSLARDVRVVESMVGGVRLVATAPSRGECASGPPVDCTIAALEPGSTARIFVVVKAQTTGRKSLTARVESPTPDPNLGNNGDAVEFDVSARRSEVEPGAYCRVPRLKGLTKSAARRALVAAGCRLGRTAHRRFRSGRRLRVKRQRIPPRVRVAAGTRVGITIRR